MKTHVTLAIEAAIAGGSLSLIRDGEELGNWVGRSDVSKAEELLVDVDAVLTACSVSRHDISRIAVSAGPGSFTGIRIGLATALGLKAGLGVPMTSVSALEAIARQNIGTSLGHVDPLIVAVPVGRDAVCLQVFDTSEREVAPFGAPRSIPESELSNIHAARFVLHAALFKRYPTLPSAVDFGANIAYAVGQLAAASPDRLTEPLFISKSV